MLKLDIIIHQIWLLQTDHQSICIERPPNLPLFLYTDQVFLQFHPRQLFVFQQNSFEMFGTIVFYEVVFQEQLLQGFVFVDGVGEVGHVIVDQAAAVQVKDSQGAVLAEELADLAQ
jgi:hypothetical protein